MPQAIFGFAKNTVEENVFLGDNTRLVEVSGAIMNITQNVVRFNGFLNVDQHVNHTDSVASVY